MVTLGLGGGLNAFQIGQSLGSGQSALGAFVDQLTERMKTYDALKAKSEFETAGAIQQAQVVEPIKAQAQFGALFGTTSQPAGVTKPTSAVEAIRNIQLRPGESLTFGPYRREVPTPTLERGQAVQSAKTVLSVLEGLENRILPSRGGDPTRVFTRGIPFIPGSLQTGLDFATLELEITTARGGKQLTSSERQLIRQVFPNRRMALEAAAGDETTLQDSITRLKRISQGLIDYFDPNIGQADLSRIQADLEGFEVLDVQEE